MHFRIQEKSLQDSGVRNIILDHVLLPEGGADWLGEPGGHLCGAEQAAGTNVILFPLTFDVFLI